MWSLWFAECTQSPVIPFISVYSRTEVHEGNATVECGGVAGTCVCQFDVASVWVARGLPVKKRPQIRMVLYYTNKLYDMALYLRMVASVAWHAFEGRSRDTVLWRPLFIPPIQYIDYGKTASHLNGTNADEW